MLASGEWSIEGFHLVIIKAEDIVERLGSGSACGRCDHVVLISEARTPVTPIDAVAK